VVWERVAVLARKVVDIVDTGSVGTWFAGIEAAVGLEDTGIDQPDIVRDRIVRADRLMADTVLAGMVVGRAGMDIDLELGRA
jgi:hypothetical protein